MIEPYFHFGSGFSSEDFRINMLTLRENHRFGTGGHSILLYSSVMDASNEVLDGFMPGKDKIDLSALGTFIFSGGIPRANALWMVREGHDLRLLGDIGGTPDQPIINILFKNITTLGAADVGAIDVINNRTIDAKNHTANLQLHLDDWLNLPDAIGTPYADRLVGTNHDNVLHGQNNDDRLYGKGWNDQLYGAGGDDFLQGGDGHDLLDGGTGVDTADYSDHTAPIVTALQDGELVQVRVNGRSEDTLASIENVTGGSEDDQLIGDKSPNILTGLYGRDHLYGREGNDTLSGGYGRDFLDGGAGIDTADYSDHVIPVNVSLHGEKRAKVYVGTHVEDVIVGIENVTGGSENDRLLGDNAPNALTGLRGDDHLHGGGGDDTLTGGYGRDFLDGGAGIDTADYSDHVTPIRVILQDDKTTRVYVDQRAEDTITNIQNVTGGSAGDHLMGDASANILIGLSGDDHLYGRGGPDTLTGGGGKDTFMYQNQEETKGDIITDFVSGEDLIDFSRLGHITFSAQGARAYSTWVERSGTDLKILGDWNNDTETHEINMTLQSVASITAADLNLG